MSIRPAMILPELNGMPIEFTKNNSEALKKAKVQGNKNLNTKANTKMATTLAMMNFFEVMSSYLL